LYLYAYAKKTLYVPVQLAEAAEALRDLRKKTERIRIRSAIQAFYSSLAFL
jgi:hypothetical protein